MEVIEKIDIMQRISDNLRKNDKTIGFVPTMGYFHEGHLSLMRKARHNCDTMVISIFVNPTQFGPEEDFDRYPRDIKRDFLLAKKEGVDYIFYPTEEEMYEKEYRTFVEVKKLSWIMCGKARSEHFRGVCTVVLKLFNIIKPHIVYFGEKDYQQLVIIKKMVEDLNIDIKIISGKTIRERDGLALSSRNKYLLPEERKNAAIIFKCLNMAEEMIVEGEKNLEKIKIKILKKLENNKFVKKVEYFDIRDPVTLEEKTEITKKKDKILAATAVWIGNTRLIDNKIIES